MCVPMKTLKRTSLSSTSVLALRPWSTWPSTLTWKTFRPTEVRRSVASIRQGAFDLFAGDQLVVVGRYKQPGDAKVTIRGKVDQAEQSFDFPAKLVEYSADDSQAFVEKLWALRRVGEIIDEIDLHGKNQELVNELVALATKHGILTPYTSFLADETANVRDLASNQARTGFALDALQLESGASAFGQRLMKNDLQRVRQAPASGYAPGIAADADLGGMGAGMGYPGMSGGGGYPGAADPGSSRLAAGRQSGAARSRGRRGAMPGMGSGAAQVDFRSGRRSSRAGPHGVERRQEDVLLAQQPLGRLGTDRRPAEERAEDQAFQ